MEHLLKSFRLFALGYASGFAVFALMSITLPQLRQLLLAMLTAKVQSQEALLGSAGYGVFINNLLASLLCSYGGFFATIAFLRLGSDSDPRLRHLRRLDRRLGEVGDEALKFYLSLFTFPVFILFLNGAVLGFLLGFFVHSPGEYFARLMPHALTELPAILLSGSIGLKIAESVLPELGTDFRARLKQEAVRSIPAYTLVVLLLAVSAYLET